MGAIFSKITKNLTHLLIKAEISNLKDTLITTKTSAPLNGLETNLRKKIKYLIKINNNIFKVTKGFLITIQMFTCAYE